MPAFAGMTWLEVGTFVRNCPLVGIDKDHARFLSSEAEAVIIQCDDTRAARLNHLDFGVLADAHFVQAVDERAVAVDLDDAGTLAGCKEFKRDDRHFV